jgi:hypothetical protein
MRKILGNGVLRINKDIRLILYPNPASDQLKISFTADKVEKYYCKIADAQGRTVFLDNFVVTRGNNQHVLSDAFAKLAPGYYKLLLYSNSNNISGSFVKVRE